MAVEDTNHLDPETFRRACRVRLLLMDCDGVLTDGRLYFTEEGEAMKVFHARDGQGIALWHASGFRSGIITGRGSAGILRRRADELGIHYLLTGSKDMAEALRSILELEGLEPDEVAYIGDDLGDVSVFRSVGFSIAVADAADEVFDHVFFVTATPGGRGAVREAIDLLLRAKAAEGPKAQ
jgi:3-deoxy-D-manno-octulosonate 8-phosphate phosphatase (KDO 8-P phosphatase)